MREGETEAGGVAGSSGRKRSKIPLVSGVFFKGSGIRDVHFLLGSAARWVEPPAASGGDGRRDRDGFFFFWTLGWERPIASADGVGNRWGGWKMILGRPSAAIPAPSSSGRAGKTSSGQNLGSSPTGARVL